MVDHEQAPPSAERFDALAHDYDRTVRLGEWLLLRRLRRHLLGGVSGKILEIGVGTGANFPHYPPNVQLFGIDLSPEMLHHAQVRAGAVGLNAYLNVMDAAKLTFPDDVFDTVISTLTLCSVEDSQRVLGEMARVCAPHGRLLFIEHGRGQLGWINRWLDRTSQRHREEFGCCPNLDMEQLLRASGLQIERVEAHVWGYVKVFWVGSTLTRPSPGFGRKRHPVLD